MTKIEQAQAFAHAAHDSIGQKRKYQSEPYWVHTDQVADLVASVGADEDAVCAAHLHDVLEDVTSKNPKYDAQRIMREFGSHVMDMVIGLTDRYTKERYPKLNRAARKKLERERFSIEPPDVKTIKLADLYSNTESIVAFGGDFAKVYVHEILELLPYLLDANPVLLQRVSVQIMVACPIVGIEIPVIKG